MPSINALEAPLTMSSREIAELTGKEHKNVIRDIRTMLAELVDGSGLSHVQEQRDARGYTACFLLPKRETMVLVTGYSIPLRARVVDRWMELEEQQYQRGPCWYASRPWVPRCF